MQVLLPRSMLEPGRCRPLDSLPYRLAVLLLLVTGTAGTAGSPPTVPSPASAGRSSSSADAAADALSAAYAPRRAAFRLSGGHAHRRPPSPTARHMPG